MRHGPIRISIRRWLAMGLDYRARNYVCRGWTARQATLHRRRLAAAGK